MRVIRGFGYGYMGILWDFRNLLGCPWKRVTRCCEVCSLRFERSYRSSTKRGFVFLRFGTIPAGRRKQNDRFEPSQKCVVSLGCNRSAILFAYGSIFDVQIRPSWLPWCSWSTPDFVPHRNDSELAFDKLRSTIAATTIEGIRRQEGDEFQRGIRRT